MCDFLGIDKAKWGEHGMNFLEEKVINAIVLLGNIECIILFTETLHEISIFCKIKIIIPKTLFNELFLNKFFRSPPSFS